MRVELSDRARADVKEIIRYTIESFGRTQAEEYLDGLYHSFDLLADNPQLGRALAGETRRYVYRAHLVFYEIRKDAIRVAHIRNAKQDLPPEWR